MTQPTEPQKMTFADKMRVWFRWYLNPIAGFFNRLGIRPNTVTLIGLTGTIGCAVLIAFGKMTWAGILLLIMGPVDAMDGALARLRNEASDWGAFVDAVTDRYSELFLFLGFMIYYLLQANVTGVILLPGSSRIRAGVVYKSTCGCIKIKCQCRLVDAR